MTIDSAFLLAFLDQVDSVVAHIENDDGGRMEGAVRLPGNGGLLSRETIRQTSLLRRDATTLRTMLEAAPDVPPTAREKQLESALLTCSHLVAAVKAMKVPQTVEEAGLQVALTIGPALIAASSAIDACLPSPAVAADPAPSPTLRGWGGTGDRHRRTQLKR